MLRFRMLLGSNSPRSISAAAIFCFIAAAASAQQPVEYRVSFPAPEHHYAQVEVTWSGVTATTLEARMSRSSRGPYAIHNFAKNGFDVHAFDSKDREIKPLRPNPY